MRVSEHLPIFHLSKLLHKVNLSSFFWHVSKQQQGYTLKLDAHLSRICHKIFHACPPFKWEETRMKSGCQRTFGGSSVRSPSTLPFSLLHSTFFKFPHLSSLLFLSSTSFVVCRPYVFLFSFPEASCNKAVMMQTYFGWGHVYSLGLIITKPSSSSSSSLSSSSPLPSW